MKLTGKELGEGIRQVGFIVLLVALLLLIVHELNYFVSAALGGFTLYMLLRKPHRWLVARKWPRMVATAVLLLATVVVLVGCGGGVASIIMPKLRGFHPHVVIDNVNAIHDWIFEKTGFNIFSKDVIDQAIASLGSILPDVLAGTGKLAVNGFMSFVLAFFMLQGGEPMERNFVRNMPLCRRNVDLLRHETHNIVISNAIGIPIIVIGHSIVSGLAYWWLGAGDPVVWGMLTGLCGLVPVVGTAAVWVPLAINLLAAGQIWQGLVLAAYGALVVANVDNVLRMVLLNKYADVHPLITLFGIILGLNLFGFWGIIFGPLLISGFLLLIKIYKNEFLTDTPT